MFPIKDTVPNRTFPYTIWLLIVSCGIVFLFEASLPPELLEDFIYYFGVVPATGGGVAWWGHIGGFIAGIVLMPFFRKASPSYY